MRLFRLGNEKSRATLLQVRGAACLVVAVLLQHGLSFYGASRRFKLERVRGIEPGFSAWKADALPLSYTRVNLATHRFHALPQVRRYR